MSDKPIKARPQFYALCLQQMQEIARDNGYNLIVHGSMDRDMDLVAVAWVDNPAPHMQLLNALEISLCGYHSTTPEQYLHSVLPGGRDSYVINLNRGGRWNAYHDEQYYLDISFTPLKS